MQLEALPTAWVKDPDLLPQPGPRHLDGTHEVGVVGDHDGHLVLIVEAVQQQVGCEIDVGTLLLGVEYLDAGRAGFRRPRQRPPLGLCKEVPVVDGQVGDGF